MKKRLLLVLLALSLVVSMAAFSACEAEEAPPVVEEEAPPVVEEEEAPVVEEEEVVWEWPEKMLIATASIGGYFYALDVAWSSVFAQDTGVTVRVVAEENEQLRYVWMKEGRITMGALGGNNGADKTQAVDAYAHREYGPAAISVFWTSSFNTKTFAVRGDSPIRTIYDVEPGMKIAVMVGKGMERVYEAALAWGNLTLDDVVIVPFGTFAAHLRSLIDGTADLVFAPDPSNAVIFEAEAAPHGLHWIEFDPVADPEGAARWMEFYPCEQWGEVKFGVPSSVGVKSSVGIGPIATARDTDPDLIYNLVKWLHENWELYKDKHYQCKVAMGLDIVRGYLDFSVAPVHEGTARYFKEIGEWTEADDLRNKYNIWLQDWYIKIYQEAIDKADAADVEVNPLNEEWVELWENYKVQIGIPVVKTMLDAEITEAIATWGIE